MLTLGGFFIFAVELIALAATFGVSFLVYESRAVAVPVPVREWKPVLEVKVAGPLFSRVSPDGGLNLPEGRQPAPEAGRIFPDGGLAACF